MEDTFVIILDYCGGSRTDRLYEQLAQNNPQTDIFILDNASPDNKSLYVSHQNQENSFIGGGIKDCIRLAIKSHKQFLLFITNDIKIKRQIPLWHLEKVMLEKDDVVQVSASLTESSDKTYYPWMINKRSRTLRKVPHADFLFCCIRLLFRCCWIHDV